MMGGFAFNHAKHFLSMAGWSIFQKALSSFPTILTEMVDSYSSL
jgi:hypothetical protein